MNFLIEYIKESQHFVIILTYLETDKITLYENKCQLHLQVNKKVEFYTLKQWSSPECDSQPGGQGA